MPLSDAATDLLRRAAAHNRSDAMFGVSTAGMSGLVKAADVGGTVHGFRSTFRDWCRDTGVDRELAESALAHLVGDQTEIAYARSDLLDRRRVLMQRWADYVSGPNSDRDQPVTQLR